MLVTAVLVVFVGGLEKHEHLRLNENESEESEEDDEDQSSDSVSKTKVVVAAVREKLVIPSVLVTETANAYCSGLFNIALCLLVVFFQAYAFMGQLTAETVGHVRFGGYASSERQDWVQFVFGTAGWESRRNSTDDRIRFEVSSQDNVPIVGGVLFGLVLGYILFMLLLSMYGAYTATPIGGYAPLVFESRGLTIANTVMVMGVRPAVRSVFARCGNGDWDVAVGALLMFLMCFDDHIIMGVLYLVYAKEHEGKGKLKWYTRNWEDRWWHALWMSFMAFLPFIIASTNAAQSSGGTGGEGILIASLVVTLITLVVIWSRQLV